jgi:hypothetical protein
MIADVLALLKDHLNAKMQADGGWDDPDPPVVFPVENGASSSRFAQDKVSILLVNIERDNTFRPADPHLAIGGNGERVRVAPPLSLHLFVLFAARYVDYIEGLRRLSQVVENFQGVPTIDRDTAPELDARIEKLVLELVTPSLTEQRDLWCVLRASYLPSALYRVKLVTFESAGVPAAPAVTETSSEVVLRGGRPR